MKKYLVLFLLFLPVVSYAVPSVRALGSGKAVVPASATVKSGITPARTVEPASGNTTEALSVSSVSTDNSSSRFPVGVTSGTTTYNNNTSSQTSGGTTTVVTSGVSEDYPKFDAIRTSAPTGTPPDGYVYMWVEQ